MWFNKLLCHTLKQALQSCYFKPTTRFLCWACHNYNQCSLLLQLMLTNSYTAPKLIWFKCAMWALKLTHLPAHQNPYTSWEDEGFMEVRDFLPPNITPWTSLSTSLCPEMCLFANCSSSNACIMVLLKLTIVFHSFSRGWHSNLSCTPIFVLSQSKSQGRILVGQRSSIDFVQCLPRSILLQTLV